jgi:hypothetical protein
MRQHRGKDLDYFKMNCKISTNTNIFSYNFLFYMAKELVRETKLPFAKNKRLSSSFSLILDNQIPRRK